MNAPSSAAPWHGPREGASRSGWSGKRAGAPAFSPVKDRTITRLAVLKAAAAFAARRPTAASADVLKVAAAWERWVLRSD